VNIHPGSDDDGWVVPDPVTLADGTRIQLYKDGEALHAAYEAVAQARFLICLEVYIFANDDTGRAFTDLLCRKARQGVRVYMIYDDLGSLGAGELFERLRAAGVRLAQFHPVFPWELKFGWRPWNRDHRKLLLIDNRLAGMGGLNIGGNYAGSWVVRNVRNLGGVVAGQRIGDALGKAAARVAGGKPPARHGPSATPTATAPPRPELRLLARHRRRHPGPRRHRSSSRRSRGAGATSPAAGASAGRSSPTRSTAATTRWACSPACPR
jgi:hypothetical protein